MVDTVENAIFKMGLDSGDYQRGMAAKVAADERGIASGEKVVVTQDKVSRATRTSADSMDRLLGRLDPRIRAEQTLQKHLDQVHRFEELGIGTAAQRAAAISLATQRFNEAIPAASRFGSALATVETRAAAATAMLTRMLLPLAAGAGGVLTGRAFFINTIEQEKALAQLDAVIRSTGGAAGFTSGQLAAMATDLQRVTKFGDESVMTAQGMLLTFTRIGHDVFPDATKAILDVSTAMGQDLKSSTVQIGKALNDPIKGLTALQRIGVSFTASQKDQIKAMVEAGRVADAQRIIIKELGVEFGGSARAARDTLGGALAGLSNAFGDLFEVTGPGSRSLRESIERVTNLLSDPGTIAAVQNFGATLFGAFADTIDLLRRNSELLPMIGGAIIGGKIAGPAGAVVGALGVDAFTNTLRSTASDDQPFRTDEQAVAFYRAQRSAQSGFAGRFGVPDAGSGGVTSSDVVAAYGRRAARSTGPTEDQVNAAERAQKAIDKVTDSLQFQMDQLGRTAREQAIYNQLNSAGVGINTEAGRKIADAVGALYDQQAALKSLNERMDLFRGLTRDALGTFVSGLRDGKSAIEALTDTLGRLGDRLADMALDKAMSAIFPTFGGISSVGAGLYHDGGVAGSPTATRYVHPAYFDDAPRYHRGGIAGLRAGEVAAILQRGERVIPRGGGGGGGPVVNVIVNSPPGMEVTQQEERPRSDGGVDLELTIDRVNTKNMLRPGTGTSRAGRASGLQPPLIRR